MRRPPLVQPGGVVPDGRCPGRLYLWGPREPGPGAGSGSDSGTALEAAAGSLADALASGDFSAVGFTSADPQAVGEEYAATVEGLEDLEPTVTVADVSEPSGEQPTADRDVRLDLAHRPGRLDLLQPGDVLGGRRASGWPSGTSPTIEPSLSRVGHPRPGLPRRQARRHPRRRRPGPGHQPAGRADRHRPQQGRRGQGGRVGPRPRAARRHRRRGVRQAGRGLRAARLRRGDRLPPGRGAGRRALRSTPDQGRRGHRGRAAAGADQGLRGADPRLGRRGDGRDDRGEPRLRGRRRRRVCPGSRRGTTSSCAARPARPSTRSAPTARPASSSATTPSTGSRCS